MSPKHYPKYPKMQILNIKWCHFYKEKRGEKIMQQHSTHQLGRSFNIYA